MDSDETARRVIGLLTTAYTVDHEGGNREDFAALVNPLLRDMLSNSYPANVEDPQNVRKIVRKAAGRAVEELKPTISEMVATFLSAFIIISRHYETDYPDANILGILQSFESSTSGND
jgi:hypothetical protein